MTRKPLTDVKTARDDRSGVSQISKFDHPRKEVAADAPAVYLIVGPSHTQGIYQYPEHAVSEPRTMVTTKFGCERDSARTVSRADRF